MPDNKFRTRGVAMLQELVAEKAIHAEREWILADLHSRGSSLGSSSGITSKTFEVAGEVGGEGGTHDNFEIAKEIKERRAMARHR